MLTLAELGLSKEELQERVIERIADQLLSEKICGEDGIASLTTSSFQLSLHARIKSHVEATISKLADETVLPNVSKYIEDLCLQETNKWGETKGAALTFREYLVSRAEYYLREPVNYEGKTKEETGSSYSFSSAQTRITYLVHKHLQYTIESAMKDAVKNVTGVMSGALAETCKIRLQEIVSSLKVNIATK